MRRVLCALPNCSEEVSGVQFSRVPQGMVSEPIEDAAADRFLSIPGYFPYEEPIDPRKGKGPGKSSASQSVTTPATPVTAVPPGAPLSDALTPASTQDNPDGAKDHENAGGQENAGAQENAGGPQGDGSGDPAADTNKDGDAGKDGGQANEGGSADEAGRAAKAGKPAKDASKDKGAKPK